MARLWLHFDSRGLMRFDVFISYSTKDAVAAKAACAALEVAKIRCWMAPRDIVPGARWGASIVRAINQCRVMVLIFSGSANGSVQVQREVDQAFNKSKTVIPLRIEDVKPADELAYYLDTVHWLDAITPPLERNLGKLVATVQALLPTTEQEPAATPEVDDAQAAQAQDEARAEDERREQAAGAGPRGTDRVQRERGAVDPQRVGEEAGEQSRTERLREDEETKQRAEEKRHASEAQPVRGAEQEKAPSPAHRQQAQGKRREQLSVDDRARAAEARQRADAVERSRREAEEARQKAKAERLRQETEEMRRSESEAEQWRFAEAHAGQRAEQARRTDEGRIKVDAPIVHGGRDGWFAPGAGKTEWFKDLAIGPEMVVIPAGSFMMGSPEVERGESRERPQHRVTFARGFAVGRYAVTWNEWKAFAGRLGTFLESLSGHGNHPVTNVSWNKAKAYVEWLAKTTGKPYRLLSEAEWEYSARAGSTTAFWWGHSISMSQANYENHFRRWSETTLAVDSFEPNPWGLYQVHGNVWEWTEDCSNDLGYRDAPNDGSAWTSGDCSCRVIRGGSWKSSSDSLRSAYRVAPHTDNRYRNHDDIGFRVARTLLTC